MNTNEMILWSAYIIGGYLLGGVLFARRLPMALRRMDICQAADDGNPGVYNVFRTCGKLLGGVCLALELGKGFLPIWMACRVLPMDSFLFAAVMAAPVLGHATAPFDRDVRGGKAISATFGALLGLLPECLIVFWLAAVYIALSTFLRIPSHRRRSIFTFVLFALGSVLTLVWQGRGAIALGCAAIALIVIVRHIHSPEEEPVKAKTAF